MHERGEGVVPEGFAEVYALIERYATTQESGDNESVHQCREMALKLISSAYDFSWETTPLRNAKTLVERVLREYAYFFPYGGIPTLHPRSIDAVVAVALSRQEAEDMWWGEQRLLEMIGAVREREEYPGYERDLSRLWGELYELRVRRQNSAV